MYPTENHPPVAPGNFWTFFCTLHLLPTRPIFIRSSAGLEFMRCLALLDALVLKSWVDDPRIMPAHGGRYWTRTSDLLLVRQALSPTELIAPIPGGVVRLAGLEPTTSASAGQRSIQLSYKRIFVADTLPSAISTTDADLPVLVPKVGFEPTRPRGTLRPERSASAVPPLRPLPAPLWWAILDSNQ